MIYAIIYGIIGLFIALIDFEVLYRKEYNQLKKTGEAEDAYVCIMLAAFTLLWPALIVWRYIKFLINVKKGNYKFQ